MPQAFDTSYNLQFPLLVNGEDKGAAWQSAGIVPSYLSLGYAEVPNYLGFLGAYGPIAHGSNIPIIEAYTEYAVQLIAKMQVENIMSLRPKALPTQHFLNHAKEYLKRTAWTGPCSSWFKGGKKTGTPVSNSSIHNFGANLLFKTVFPGSRLSFLKLVQKPRYEDFEIAYDDAENTFAFMGSGFHAIAFDGSDVSWYLGTPQHDFDPASIKEQMNGQEGQQIKHTII